MRRHVRVLCLPKDHAAAITFRVVQLFFLNMKALGPLETLRTLSQWHGFASQKTSISSSAVITWNLTCLLLVTANMSSGFLHWGHCCTYIIHSTFNILFVTKVINFNLNVVEINEIHFDCLAGLARILQASLFPTRHCKQGGEGEEEEASCYWMTGWT